MLYNVFYKEEFFPAIVEVDFIRNETTGEVYSTVGEFIESLVNSKDTINHIGKFNVFFPFLEKGFQESGYTPKITKTEHFSHYRSKLVPNSYSVDIVGKIASSNCHREVKKLRIASPLGDRYLISFDDFTDYHLINTDYTDDEVEFQSYLNSIGCRRSSPAGAMKEDIGHSSYFSTKTSKGGAELMWELKKTARNPAIIEAFALGPVGKGYCYDINSMYLAQLKKIEHLPDLRFAHPVTSTMVVPPNHFGVHHVNVMDSVIALPGQVISSGDWLLPPSKEENPFKEVAERLWNDKQKFKKEGGCAYRFYKMKANSFIGCFAQRKRALKHFSSWHDTEGREDKYSSGTMSRFDIFGIVTALARQTLIDYMNMARDAGCEIYQCNTDGFITDKPIPGFESSEELGGLRLDKELNNLFIFSQNQYAADGVQCISGLPGGMYQPGVYEYTFETPRYMQHENQFKLIETHLDLYKGIRELEYELEDLYKNEKR